MRPDDPVPHSGSTEAKITHQRAALTSANDIVEELRALVEQGSLGMVAEELGLSHSRISEWLNGKRPLS